MAHNNNLASAVGTALGAYITIKVVDELFFETKRRMRKRRLKRSLFGY